MTYVADLHTHSRYARGTSRRLTLETLARWAKIKGIDLLASGDFTHPEWFLETKSGLRETGDGLMERDGVLFVLGTEVNCVGEVAGRNRRVHLLILAPELGAAERINASLATRGNLGSDGRPTLRMTPKDLVHELLDIDERCVVIPAHLWTPWFGLFGSKSGFDSLEEAFGDMVHHIYAIETGLSSDPAMNWRVPSLDRVSIVSFSDAHSPQKLGRELTVIEGEPSYDGLVDSLKTQRIAYTVEFFPEEGKYHYSGHRSCGVRYSPSDVSTHGTVCPKCGRILTLGVLERVEELAGREVKTWMDGDGFVRGADGRPPFKNLVSLRQIISESLGVGINAKKVEAAYLGLVSEFGSELVVLTDAPVPEVASASGERTADGVARVRAGEISIEPGYDGVYGQVRVWPEPSG